jgi:4-alpha-glucanotransferase
VAFDPVASPSGVKTASAIANQRLAGILQPVFSIRTSDDLGIGDTDGVRQLVDWCHRHGVGLLQILPINQTGPDHCPYHAISALAIDPVTLAVSPRHIPDLTVADFNQLARPKLLAALRAGPVNYPRVKALKLALLECAFDQFTRHHLENRTSRAAEFQQFAAHHSAWLCDYALFRALMTENNEAPDWERWPATHQYPARARRWVLALPPAHRARFQRHELFFMYVQWLAFGQWQALKDHAARKHVALMGDIPIGIGRCSADVWSQRANFDLNWSAGAPPEKLFRTNAFARKWGQNWGTPLYRWNEMRRRDFDWWRTRVGLARQIFDLCRLDHVMGLFRLYAFPWTSDHDADFLPLNPMQAARRTGGRLPGFRPFPDDTAPHAAANQRRGEEFLRVILDAAGKMTIVAEDLGFVPDYVRPTLQKLGIPGFRVPGLCRDPDGSYSDPAGYPRLSVTQPSTHDHPPLAAAWAANWQNIRRGRDTKESRAELRRAMEFAGLQGQPMRKYSDSLHQAMLRAALRSNSDLAVVLLADVFGQTTRCNLPGTVSRKNWSARMTVPVEKLDRDPVLRAKTVSFSKLIRETGRLTRRTNSKK